MSLFLSDLLILFRSDAAARAAFSGPVLWWEEAAAPEVEHWHRTELIAARGSGKSTSQRLSGPKVLRVEKRAKANEPFEFGITLGRTDSNDLVLEHHSVSRFHAFLRLDEATRTWLLTDAESRNGTWVNGRKLVPNEAVAVRDEAKLRFGDAELTFLMPASFRRIVDPLV